MSHPKRNTHLLGFGLIVLSLVVINLSLGRLFLRIDLTEEKRFSLSETTIALVKGLDEVLLVKVYLEGDFPPGFQKLQIETQRLLDELRAYNPKIQYQFIDPSDQESETARNEVYQQLQSKGLTPYQLETQEKGGSRMLQVFPGAILSLGDQEIAVNILQAQIGQSPESQMNASVEKLEYTLANAIRKISTTSKPRIAFIEGHGELHPRFLADLGRTLSEHYVVERFNLREFAVDSITQQPSLTAQLQRLNTFDLAFIPKPTKGFTDLDLYLLDQFIMAGGQSLWALDMVQAEMDSLSEAPEFLAVPLDEKLRLRNSLFRYGIRVNADLVQDLLASGINDSREVLPWVYAPMVMPYVNHPITKDLNAIRLEFASSVDTLALPGVKKTILLQTSPRSAAFRSPHLVSLGRLYRPPTAEQLNRGPIPLAVLLEGRFPSAFTNRISPKNAQGQNLPLLDTSVSTRMLVIGDGDIAKNQLNVVNPNVPRGLPLQLGFDQFTGVQYGNKEFMLNAFDYLLDGSGLMDLRGRELKIRLLDSSRRDQERSFWVGLNTVVPLIVLIVFSLLQQWWRKRRYAQSL